MSGAGREVELDFNAMMGKYLLWSNACEPGTIAEEVLHGAGSQRSTISHDEFTFKKAYLKALFILRSKVQATCHGS